MAFSLTNPATTDTAGVDGVVAEYFEAFNREDYDAVVALFASEGALNPPFEEPIVGPQAIRDYLHQEAVGMKATPKHSERIQLDDGSHQVIVKGRVKARVFIVNVGWTFTLAEDGKILEATIKLLASLQELMQINRGDQSADS